MIIGDPFGYDHQSCAVGHIRDARWTDTSLRTLLTCITTDVSTGPGNSGSPIINMKGECVGMHIGVFGDATTQFGGGVVADVLEKIVSIISQYESHEQKMFTKKLLPFQMYANAVPYQLEFQSKNTNISFSSDLVGYIITQDFENIIKKGDVLTHLNKVKVGTYDGSTSIGDVLWFHKNHKIECTIVRHGTTSHTLDVELYDLPDKDDVADRPFRQYGNNLFETIQGWFTSSVTVNEK